MRAPLIIFGTLTGLVAGVAIGRLTAPCSGREARQKVSEQANNLRKVILGFRTRTANSVDDVKSLLSQEIEGLEPVTKNKILELIEAEQQKRY